MDVSYFPGWMEVASIALPMLAPLAAPVVVPAASVLALAALLGL